MKTTRKVKSKSSFDLEQYDFLMPSLEDIQGSLTQAIFNLEDIQKCIEKLCSEITKRTPEEVFPE